MSVVDGSFDHPLKLEEKATAPLAGGILQYGYQCGMLWGAALAAGAQAYQLHGPGPMAETAAILATQRLLESFRAHNRYINCQEITEIEWKPSSQGLLLKQIGKFFIKGGPIGCFRMAAAYAPVAFDDVRTALSEDHIPALSSPVSCATLLAQKMGASEMHAVMAAGFAGGIGLSGGACGVLGAAIWFLGMRTIKEGVKEIGLAPPGAEDAVERFLTSSDYEFECSKIVGRRFESVEDHARYLQQGGCSNIIEALGAI